MWGFFVSFGETLNTSIIMKTKTILFALVLFASNMFGQQQYDTIIVPKKIVVHNPGLSDSVSRAGEQLNLAATNYFTGLGMYVIGSLFVGVGAGLLNPPLMMIGGCVTIVGFVNNVMAWEKIGKAGRLMKRNR